MEYGMISIIACVGKNGELGKNNGLCFHLKEDMAFFRSKTIDHAVVMGSNTYRSIGGPLKGRVNYVLTRDPNILTAGAIQCTDLVKFLTNMREDIFVIGGASVYAQALPYADRLLLTEVDASADADVFFPEFNKDEYTREVLKEGEENGLHYRMVEYTKKGVV